MYVYTTAMHKGKFHLVLQNIFIDEIPEKQVRFVDSFVEKEKIFSLRLHLTTKAAVQSFCMH